MSTASAPLRKRQELLVTSIRSRLQELVFANRYALHPRRLAQLSEELGQSFLGFVEDPDGVDPLAKGKDLAKEGIGARTILAVAETLRGFCRHVAGKAVRAGSTFDVAERYGSRLLEGFMGAQEELILKDQEQLRQALSSALEQQSRELLVKNHAVNTSINGIMLTELDGTVTWVNASFLTLWGYATTSEVVGKSVTAFWADEEAPRVQEVLRASGGWRGELVGRKKDGSSFNVELSASLIRNEEGTSIGVMTSFVDVTERKQLQAQIIQAQKMEALGQLAGGITHDFNNLLTAIAGFLQFLLQEAPRDSRSYQDLMQIQAAVDRGAGLTRQLRLFTRQTAGKRAVISLNDVVQETWEILRHTFPPEIGIRLDLEPALDMVEADPNQMSQVLMNLCVNARDAMTEPGSPQASRTLTIATSNVSLGEDRVGKYSTARPGQYVAVRVRDTGSGIAAEVLDRLFIPFITTKSLRSGTGLGLAVVYGIVSNHQGFIDVSSALGEGTEFELLFPRTARSRQESDRSPITGLPHGRGTILVVDDEQQIREIMSRVLTSCGYTVISAGDGREALEKYGTGRDVDLVILDAIMPVLGGRECLARLRERNPEVRVLVATGYTSDGSVQEMLHHGVLGIIEKPLDLKSFAQSVANHLSSVS